MNIYTMDFNLIITGPRAFDDYDLFVRKCDYYISFINDVNIHILTGSDGHCEEMAQRYANERGYALTVYELDSNAGNRAPSLRNNAMVNDAHGAICFWDGKSGGVRLTLNTCKRKDIPYKIVRFDEV